MRLTRAVLVIVDISGYTRFVTRPDLSLQHAEQIITELMEAVIDRASHPLSVNKLEGDAALLFREFAPAEAEAAAVDALAQLRAFFEAFAECRDRVAAQRSACGCDACRNALGLSLKGFVHVGEIAVKQVRRFEELAGEPVIFVHRLTKNHVDGREYVLASEAVRALVAEAVRGGRAHAEELEGLGPRQLWLYGRDDLPALAVPSAPAGDAPDFERIPGFRHLPPPTGWRARLRRWFAGHS